MLRKSVYPKIESKLNQIAAYLEERGFTPNQLTLGGTALSFLAGVFYAGGAFFLAGLVLIAASLGDLLDGALARHTQQASKFGAFLDSTLDRYSDFFLFGGLAIYFARQDQGGWMLIVLGILLGVFATSYAKARAENLIEDCSVGMFERPERILALLTGSLISPLMPLALWVLLIGTQATAIQRILFVKKSLAEENPADSSSS